MKVNQNWSKYVKAICATCITVEYLFRRSSSKIKGGFVTFSLNHRKMKIKEWLHGLLTQITMWGNFTWLNIF